MKTNRLNAALLSGVLLSGLLASCGSDEPSPNTNTTIAMQGQMAAGASNTGGRFAPGVVVDSFVVNIREIEFEFEVEGEQESDAVEDLYENIEMEGPFVVSLLSNEGTGTIQELLTTPVPNAVYEEIEFNFHRNNDPASVMHGKSIYANGTIDGVPFVFWHDTDEEFEIDFEDAAQNISLNGGSASVIINMNLGQLFDGSLGVDLSTARDGNQDGLIEISPEDEDGNNELAQMLKNKLEEITDLLDEN